MAQLRPKYLDLFQIHLPIPGFGSILHRISGALLFLFLPLLLYFFQSSLAGPEVFAVLSREIDSPLVKLVLIGLLWAFLHHLCAGIRHVLLDIGIGLAAARLSSKLVLGISIALTMVAGMLLW